MGQESKTGEPRDPTGNPGVGARIREARKKEGLTQGQLGKRIGKTQGLVSQYEKGTTAPPSEILTLIARHTRESVGYLLSGTPSMAKELAQFHEEIASHLTGKALQKLKKLSAEQRMQIIGVLGHLIATTPDAPTKRRSSKNG